MEFKFNLNDFFRENIVEIGPNLIPPGYSPADKRALWDTVTKVSEVVNSMGQASAAAQGLTKSITTSDRLRNSEQKVYLLIDKTANAGRGAVTGMLKTGKKGLYVFDRDGHHYQVQPACVLDFYVHESKQRMGLGKQLFEHMLEREKVEPVKLAIDRPSDKFLGFLNKHYALDNPVKQMNNFVVFDGFFPEPVGAKTEVSDAPTPKSNQQAANGLQTAFTPYGRYGAPRPPCSMGQIIHNQSPLSHQAQEPNGGKMNGTASEPEIKYRQRQQQQNQGNAGQQHQQQQPIGQAGQQIAQNYASLPNIPEGQVQPVFNAYHQQLAQSQDPNEIGNKGAAVQPYQDAMQQHYLQQQQQYAQQMALLQQQQQQMLQQQQQQQQQQQMLQKQQQQIPREQLQAQASQPQVQQVPQAQQQIPQGQQIAQVQQQAPQTQKQIPQIQQIPHAQQIAQVQQQAPQLQQILPAQKQMTEAQQNAIAQEKLAQAQQQVAQVQQQVAQFQQNQPQLAQQMQAHVGQYQLQQQPQAQPQAQPQGQPQTQQQYAQPPQQYATAPQHVRPTMQQQYVQQQVQPQTQPQVPQHIHPQTQHVSAAPQQLTQHMPCDGMQDEQIPVTQQQIYTQQPQMAQQTYEMLKPEIQQYAVPQQQQYAVQSPAQQAYRPPEAYAQHNAAQQVQQPSLQVSEAQSAQQQGLPQHAHYQSVPNIATGSGQMPQPLHHAQSAIYQQPMYQQPAQQQYVQPPYEQQVIQSPQYAAKSGYQTANQQPMQTYYTPQGVASMQQQSEAASSMEALQAANIAQQATPVAGYSSLPSVPTQQVQRVLSGRVNAQNQQVYQQNQATAAQNVPNTYQTGIIAPQGNVQPQPRSPLPIVQRVPSGRVNPQNQQVYQQNQASLPQSVPNTYQTAHPRSPMTMASPATGQPQGVAVGQNMYAPQGMEPQVQANAGNYQYFEHPEAAAKMDHHHHLPAPPLQNAGGKAIDEENKHSPSIQEAQFEEQAPPLKLERPQSLSLQTSDEQDQIDGVIEEIIPEVKKVVIRESASPAKMATDEQPEKKKTPSHLTDQGYVDLKFYHNKLW